jgi:hypothetical protein
MTFVFVKLIVGTAIITGVIGGLFIIIINSSQSAQAQNNTSPNALVFPVDSKPYGKSYADWSAIWWQWLLSIPKDKSPAGDSTGENCGTNQQGPIWFLAGTFGGAAERTCTIPSGKAIMFSALNSECSYAEYPDEKTESDLLECAKTFQDQTTSAQVIINGTAIENLDKFRIQSPLFNVTLPENNVFGISSGPTQAVSDGLWVILKPLPVGEHKIGFKGSSVDFTTGATNTFVSDANYNVIVK